ncbi:MAG: h [Phycisphaerales bacterium]|nr:h [Phycisphaerales bacterium]
MWRLIDMSAWRRELFMKRITFCTLLVISCGLLSGPAWSDQPKPPQDGQGARPRDGDRPREGVARDGDRPREGARPRDGAGPGGEGRPGAGNDAVRRPIPPLFLALDTDGDRELSAAEIANAAKSLRKLDRNGDGKITADELRPPRPEGGNPPPGDRPRGEGDRPRPEGDRPGAGGPPDANLPPREGGTPRAGEGDRPRGERDYPRSRPAPEQ